MDSTFISSQAPLRPITDVDAARRSADPVNVVLIPSVSGGLGHVARALKLARALERADPTLRFSWVLDELKLRSICVDAVAGTGYPYRILPNAVRHERDETVRAALGEADVVIEDTCRRLIPHRRILPRLKAWISVPMPPLWDELFLDWPLLEQVDAILYTYPPIMPPPEELLPFADKLTATGPILDEMGMPARADARRRLGLEPGCRYVLYSPRGFPFGAWFGRRVLNGVVGGFVKLHREMPDLRLVLLAVPDPAAVQPRRLPPLAQIPGVTVLGVVPPEVARDYMAAADLAVVEATTSLFDAALARTPIVMVPGLIYETWLEGTWVNDADAGVVMRPEEVTHASMAQSMRAVLDPVASAIRTAKLAELVGTDGAARAVAAVLCVIEERVRPRPVKRPPGEANRAA